MRRRIAILISLMFLFSLGACKQKETEPPVPNVPGSVMPGQMPPAQMPGGQMPPSQMPGGQMPPVQMPPMGQSQGARPGMMMGKTHIIVPDSVKGKWSAAKIVLEDKATKARQEYTVNLNSDFRVPNSNLRIHAGDFLPDFRMDGVNLTSASNEPKNPALAIKVFENDKQIFPAPGRQWGWLFGKVPSIHPFEHSKYSIILKEGIRKG